MKSINTKLLTAILIPMLLIPLTGFGYAHWTDRVTEQIKMHVRCAEANIKSYKCLSEFNDELIFREPPENLVPAQGFSTLRIWTNTTHPEWYVWIGLLIQNQGPFPVKVYAPEYKVTMEPQNSVRYVTKEYFYGPYEKAEYNDVGVWGNIGGDNFEEILDPNKGVNGVKSVSPPIYLEPIGRNKLVLWIYLQIKDGPEGFYIEIEITTRTELALP